MEGIHLNKGGDDWRDARNGENVIMILIFGGSWALKEALRDCYIKSDYIFLIADLTSRLNYLLKICTTRII